MSWDRERLATVSWTRIGNLGLSATAALRPVAHRVGSAPSFRLPFAICPAFGEPLRSKAHWVPASGRHQNPEQRRSSSVAIDEHSPAPGKPTPDRAPIPSLEGHSSRLPLLFENPQGLEPIQNAHSRKTRPPQLPDEPIFPPVDTFVDCYPDLPTGTAASETSPR